MKRLFSIILSISLALGLAACGEHTVSCPAADDGATPNGTERIYPIRQEPIDYTSEAAPRSSWSVNDDITVSLEQSIYPIGTESFDVVFTNTGNQTMLYGEEFSFEYNAGGQWEPVNTVENYAFDAVGYLLFPGDTRTLTLGTWMLKEPLAEGLYRIVGCTMRVADDNDQLGYGGNYTEYPPYELEFYVSGEANLSTLSSTDAYQEGTVVTDSPFYLEIDQPSPGDTSLTFDIVNESGSDAEILLIPTLEKMTEDGQWGAVPFRDEIGFCGTPDPMPAGRKSWSEDLNYLWGDLADGDYRLSFTVTDSGGNKYTASGQFTLDDGLCGYPLAE